MPNVHELCGSIKSDEEALMVMAVLGFTIADWSFIKKVGGPKNVLHSNLLDDVLKKKCTDVKELWPKLLGMPESLAQFYESGGFLISPLSHEKSRLFKVSTAPLVFFGRGNGQLLGHKPNVSIVGSRKACSVALDATKDLAKVLAQNSICVTSGGANGIDRAAHLGATDADGATIIVPGVRANFLRDERATELSKIDDNKILQAFPYGPFYPQKNYMFVARNQFVAALADALVVVQGLKGSGTLHTVRFARTLNIPIYAIPGSVANPLSYAPNLLLHKGYAKALVDFDYFAKSLVTKSAKLPNSGAKPGKTIIDKPAKMLDLPYLLRLISEHGNSLTMDELMSLSGKSFGELQGELLSYEMAGKVFKRGAQFVLSVN